jgi:hypothetical protein
MRNRILHSCLILLALLLLGCRKNDSTRNNRVTSHDFLSNNKYEKLIVEIQYVNGYPPTTTTVDNLKTFLQQRLNKSGGIIIIQNAIPSPGKPFYTLDDIRNIEKANRTQNTNKKTLTAYFFFADGEYASNSGNSKVLGITYGNSSMVIFKKTIKDFSGGITQPPVTVLETTVIDHEFGHLLGLVNNGSSMQYYHQDEPHGMHCDDKNCLMYYLAETSDIVANLVGGNIPSLDAKCLVDLRANGGK